MSTLQPENQATEDAPRPRDDSLVTDELNTLAASNTPPAAPDGNNQAGQSDGDSATPTPENQSKKPKGLRSAERKISRLKRQLEESSQRETETLSVLKEMRAEIEELKTAKAKPIKPKPDIKDFDNPDAFAEAYSEWKTSQAPDPKPTKPKPKAEPKPSQPAPIASQEELDDFRKRGQSKVGDEFLEAIADTSLPISQPMGEYLLDADLGPELYTYLANNPDEALKLYHKTPVTVAKRLDSLEKKIKKHGHWDLDEEPGAAPESQPTGDADQSPRRSSKAPAPPSASERGTVVPDKDLEKANMDDYAASRRKQILSQGRKLF